MKITRKFLERHGARCSALDLFDKIFPQGAELTESNIRRAVRARLQVQWLCAHCAPRHLQKKWRRRNDKIGELYLFSRNRDRKYRQLDVRILREWMRELKHK